MRNVRNLVFAKNCRARIYEIPREIITLFRTRDTMPLLASTYVHNVCTERRNGTRYAFVVKPFSINTNNSLSAINTSSYHLGHQRFQLSCDFVSSRKRVCKKIKETRGTCDCGEFKNELTNRHAVSFRKRLRKLNPGEELRRNNEPRDTFSFEFNYFELLQSAESQR